MWRGGGGPNLGGGGFCCQFCIEGEGRGGVLTISITCNKDNTVIFRHWAGRADRCTGKFPNMGWGAPNPPVQKSLHKTSLLSNLRAS